MAGCDNMADIRESMYDKALVYRTACEEVIGLPGDVFVYCEDGGGRVAQ